MYKGLTGRSVSPIIVAVLHDVVRAAVAVLVTSPASTRAVRLPAHGAAWSWGDCGRTPQTESYRTSPLSSWRCSCRQTEKGERSVLQMLLLSLQTPFQGPRIRTLRIPSLKAKSFRFFQQSKMESSRFLL